MKLALPIIAATLLVALDIILLGGGVNSPLSYIGAPVIIVGGYIYLYFIRGQR